MEWLCDATGQNIVKFVNKEEERTSPVSIMEVEASIPPGTGDCAMLGKLIDPDDRWERKNLGSLWARSKKQRQECKLTLTIMIIIISLDPLEMKPGNTDHSH